MLNLYQNKRLTIDATFLARAQQSSKKWKIPTSHFITSFFNFGVPYKKFDLA